MISPGFQFVGTYHKPASHIPEASLDADASGQIGILIVNSLTAPRAGNGDSAVYWADLLAQDGYPCFRFDLPGLGDTGPDIKLGTDLLNFITRGRPCTDDRPAFGRTRKILSSLRDHRDGALRRRGDRALCGI